MKVMNYQLEQVKQSHSTEVYLFSFQISLKEGKEKENLFQLINNLPRQLFHCIFRVSGNCPFNELQYKHCQVKIKSEPKPIFLSLVFGPDSTSEIFVVGVCYIVRLLHE